VVAGRAQRRSDGWFGVPEEIVHGHVQGYGDPSQCACAGQSCLPALDLIERRPRDLGTAGKLIGAPSLGITEVSNTLSQGDHHKAILTIEVKKGRFRPLATEFTWLRLSRTLWFILSQKACWHHPKIYKTFVSSSSLRHDE
jgi:hypothetical protein